MVDSYAVEHNLTCKNPSCPSFGHVHFNCRCYSDGGLVLQHHLAHGGLLNFISGPKAMANPEAHHDTVAKLKGHLANNDQDSAVGVLQGHPMGLGSKSALEPIVRNLSDSISSTPSNPQGLQSSVSYLDAAHKGVGRIKEHASNIFEKQPKRKLDHERLSSLKKELDTFQAYPNKVFDLVDKISDGVGHYMPGHGADVGTQLATTINYLESLKPMNQKGGPLDKVMKPSAMEEYKYNKALDIAEDPLSVIHHAKDGTLDAQDLVTLHTLYPKVAQSIMAEATNTLLEKPDNLSMKNKRALSALLGQPLLFSQTPQGCQAIIKANAGAQSEQQQNAPKQSKQKATAAQLKQVDQVNKLYATPLQERQIERQS